MRFHIAALLLGTGILVACSSSDSARHSLVDAGNTASGGTGGGSSDTGGGTGTGGASSTGGRSANDASVGGGGQSGSDGSGGATLGTGGAHDASVVDASQSDAKDSGAQPQADGAPVCDGGDFSFGTRVRLQLNPAHAEHVTSFRWIQSDSTLSVNVIGEGGPDHCGDPQEFFGQAYGAPEGTLPVPVVAGNDTLLTGCGNDVTLTGANNATCSGATPLPVTTQYHFYGDATRASEVRVTRTFGFDAATTVYAGTTGLRPYVARVSLATLPNVLFPNQAETAMTTVVATSCGGDCFADPDVNWNGKWFADVDPVSGLALIVLRDPSMTSPVKRTVNYDAYSNANITSFVLVQPATGWQAPITEIEYLCFADLTSWPQTDRDAAKLPAGCGP